MNTFRFHTCEDAYDNNDMMYLQVEYESVMSELTSSTYRLSKKMRQHTLANWIKIVDCFRQSGVPLHRTYVRGCNHGRLVHGKAKSFFIVSMIGNTAIHWAKTYNVDIGDTVLSIMSDSDYEESAQNIMDDTKFQFEEYVRTHSDKLSFASHEQFVTDLSSYCNSVYRICYLLCRPDLSQVVRTLWGGHAIAMLKQDEKKRLLDFKFQRALEKHFKGVTPWIKYLYSLEPTQWIQ